MKPSKIILIRHGESQGNVDWDIYSKTPDYAIYLTEKGKEQAKDVGIQLNKLLEFNYGCYYSPYFRARQTMDEAIKQISRPPVFKKEEIRLREQEYSGKLAKGRHDDDGEREAYGKLFYRLTGGESAADVYDRVSDFIGTMNRDFQKHDFPSNVCIFGHGMTNRLFLVKWFHILAEEFETWKNPRNGEMYILELQKNDKYILTTPIARHPKGYGYQYNPPK